MEADTNYSPALGITYKLYPPCSPPCFVSEHTVIPLRIDDAFVEDFVDRSDKLDFDSMIPAAIPVCGGFNTAIGCSECGAAVGDASGDYESFVLDGEVPQVCLE